MRKKAITTDCVSCDKMSIDDDSRLLCSWGKGKKPKVMEPHKGKKPLTCNLIKDEK